MATLQTILGVIAIVAVVWAVIMALAILMASPVAIFSKARGGRFAVSKRVRAITLCISLVIVVTSFWVLGRRGPESSTRAKVSEAIALTSQYKSSMADYFREHGTFNEVSLPTLGGVTEGKYVASVALHGADGATVAVSATFRDAAEKRIRGREFRIATQNGGATWACGYAIVDPELRGNNQVEPELMPGMCR